MDSAESKPASGSTISGKLVIISIVFVALWAAGISWYFRYWATHRAVKFWGAEAAVHIRDAPVVILNNGGNIHGATPAAVQANIAATDIDVSHAHGLIYLRNALLEDHNFDWTTVDKFPFDANLYWSLIFKDPGSGKGAIVWLSDDFRYASCPDGTKMRSVSLDPVMTKGLREMFAEFTAEAKTAPGNKDAGTSESPVATPPTTTPTAKPSPPPEPAR